MYTAIATLTAGHHFLGSKQLTAETLQALEKAAEGWGRARLSDLRYSALPDSGSYGTATHKTYNWGRIQMILEMQEK